MTKKSGSLLLCGILASVAVCVGPQVRAGDRQPDYTTPIVNRAVAALGDSQTHAKYKGITFDMRFKIREGRGESAFSFKWYVLGNDKYRAEINVTDPYGQESAVFVLNGKALWISDNKETEKATGEELAELLVVLHAVRLAQQPGNLLGKEFRLSPLRELKIQDRDTVGLRIEQIGNRDIGLYFDKQTGLPVRSEFSMPNPENDNKDSQVSFTFAEPRNFGGVKYFTKMVIHQDQQEITTAELSNIQFHETLDASHFTKPGN